MKNIPWRRLILLIFSATVVIVSLIFIRLKTASHAEEGLRKFQDQETSPIGTQAGSERLRKLAEALEAVRDGKHEMDSSLISSVESLPEGEKELAETMVMFAARGKAISIENLILLQNAIRQIKSKDALYLSKTLAGRANEVKAVNGQSVLMLAFGMDAPPQILNAIVDSGIDINAVDDSGNTAAHLVLLWGSPDYKWKLDYLKKYGANFELRNKDGLSVNQMIKSRETDSQ